MIRPPPFFAHCREQRLGDVKEAIEVGVDNVVPFFGIHLFEYTVTRDTSIIDQDVNSAFFFKQFGNTGGALICVGDIKLK